MTVLKARADPAEKERTAPKRNRDDRKRLDGIAGSEQRINSIVKVFKYFWKLY
jgi:hypothetical protein